MTAQKGAPEPDSSETATTPLPAGDGVDAATMQMIELLFFAYRDFIGDPDAILADYDFGRAHHRVLHFVSRNPGMTVSDLLDILAITKQSLARVLRQLVETGFIDQRQGADDRRQRLLYVTEKGERLAAQLAEPQAQRIERALAVLGPDGAHAARRFLELMRNEPRDDIAYPAAGAADDAFGNRV